MAKKKKKGVSLNQVERIFLATSHPISLREIYKRLNPRPKDKAKIKGQLQTLEVDGKIASIGPKKFISLMKLPKVQGKIDLIPRQGGECYGFVCPDKQGLPDIFIRSDRLLGAWPHDLVQAAILPIKQGKNPEGIVLKIIQRGCKQIIAKIICQLSPNTFLVRPEGKNFSRTLVASLEQNGLQAHFLSPTTLETGILVKVELKWKTQGSHLDDSPGPGGPKALISQIFGSGKDLSTQEELVMAKYNLPATFSSSALQQAQGLDDHLSPILKTQRIDLQDQPFVTIDGARARDFDDAISVQKTATGFKLLVAIADVASFIPPGSALDQEARSRGNSFYFPTRVIPMFPEVISTDLCSLKPGQPRPVLVAQLHIDSQGQILHSKFLPALIKSKDRLTYDQVQEALDKDNQAGQIPDPEIFAMLQEARQLAKILRTKRKKQGALDFNLPEPEICIQTSTGGIEFQVHLQNQAQKIIEEFMLAANESVAKFLDEKKIPFLYRIHEPPDQNKLETLFQALQLTGKTSAITPLDLQIILNQAQDSKQSFLIRRLLLRAMMQAAYSPNNQGHFGLASSCYTHFTSPIRRYSDLVVHRALRQALGLTGHLYPLKELKKIALDLNSRERLAMEAEREIVKRSGILYLKDKIGEVFTGTVSSLSDFGFWVELDGLLLEGMVRLTDLGDNFLYLAEKNMLIGQQTGKQITIGQRLKTKLISASLERLEIDLLPQ